MIVANEKSMDAAVVAVLSKVDGILTLKEEWSTALKGFLGGKLTSFYSRLALAKV